MSTDFRLLSAARMIVDEVNELLDDADSRLIHDAQLRASAQSIAANIREGFGRRRGAERNQFLRFAKGSAQETDEHLRTNFVSKRIDASRYWRLHHRLMVVIKMLTTMMMTVAKTAY
jgi:four helix bundle protein